MNDEASDAAGAPRVTAEREASKQMELPSMPIAEASEGSIAPSPTVELGDVGRASHAVGQEDAPARERSNDMTQVGLGAADPAALALRASGTLLGIAAIAGPDSAVKEPLQQSLQPPQGSGESLPRFDDNPLIAAFPPQRQRPPSAFEGFVPLGSPTRSFSEPVPHIVSGPVPDMSRVNVDGERALRQRRASLRIAGLAAGCFGLAASLAVASQALTSPGAAGKEVVSTTPVPTDALGPQRDGKEAIPGGAAPEIPDQPAAPQPETHEAPADPRAIHEPIPASPEGERAAAGVPAEDVAEHEDSRPTPIELEPHELPTVAGAEPTERTPIDASPPVLDPHLLDELFLLETHSESYRCASPPAVEARAGERASSAQAVWREWRRAQQNGDVEAAHLTLCELARMNPNDPRVPSELAALALRWGDARGAEEAARSGLLLKAEDAALKQLLGDALALLGELAESRRLWLEPFGEDAASEAPEAIAFFNQRGKAALERSNYVKARTLFRRAAILSGGALRSSVGLSQALAGLGETRAAAAWAERAALAAPRDAKLQMAYGDALYRAGDMASARRAWSAAAQLNPSPAIRRRLARGYL
jgi:Flp pilus assembly protein TadD